MSLLSLALSATLTAGLAQAPVTPACLVGQVVDLAGTPVAGASVTLIDRLAGRPAGRIVTAADGAFSADGLRPGSYWLVVDRLGFEPQVEGLSLSSGQTLGAEVAMTPLALVLARREAREELPWLVRGLAGDPLRSSDLGLDPPLTADPSRARLVQGRLAWNAMAGTPGAAGGGDLVGSRAELEIGGTVADDARWYLDGRLDGFETESASSLAGSGATGALRYGIGYGEGDSGLRFRGQLARAKREGAGPVPLDLLESHQSYVVDYRAQGREDQVGVSVAYRAAVADGRLAAGVPNDRHAIWEGRGRYQRQLLQGHRIESSIRLRAQQYSNPNANLMAEAGLQDGMLRDARFLRARSWDAFGTTSYSWTVAGPLVLAPGLELARAAGESGRPFVRSRLGGYLELGSRARLRADWSYVVQDSYDPGQPALQPGSGGSGLRVGFERQLADGGLLLVEVLRNGYQEVDTELPEPVLREDYLLFARGQVKSDELRLLVRLPQRGRVTSYAEATFGSARGDLAALPLGYVHPGGLLRELDGGQARYLSAAIGTGHARTGTGVVVRLRRLEGLGESAGDYARVDLELDQELPWWEFVGSRLDLLLALRTYLSGSAVPDEAGGPVLLVDPAPVIAAGLGVRF